jgi:antirestriction protein ArdC
MAHALACRHEPGRDHVFDYSSDQVLAQLERGEIPWLEPGTSAATDGCNGGGGEVACRGGSGTSTALLAAGIPPEACDAEAGFLDLFAATGIDFRLGAMRTFYSPSDDMIALSDWRGRDPAEHLRDWIHELVHATGHPSRLDRELPAVFGSTGHGVEDLIAEMATASVCASLGITPSLRHPDRVERWIDLLRADDRTFGHAVRSAGVVTAYLFERRDAQAAAFDRLEAEEAGAERQRAALAAAMRRRKWGEERERWASGLVTGLEPRESLPAARHGGPTW